MAHPGQHPDAFYRGLRLLAIDGSQFSLTNTPQILSRYRKTVARRSRAAWAKLTAVVLLEVGLHNPLAVAVGQQGESEYILTQRLWDKLPRKSLVLADRLCGCQAMIASFWDACRARDIHCLFRVRSNMQAAVLKRLPDGSAIVSIAVRDPKKSRRILRWLTVREIWVRAKRPGARTQLIRFWTTLLDWRQAPALELVSLYTRRWQHELYWRQMKLELRKTEVLQSHTPETAAQEIAALVLATALLAQERSRAAAHQVPVLDISFLKCLELIRPLWQFCALAADLLTSTLLNQITRRFYQHIRFCLKPKPRARSCARAVRQPVTGWPRLLKPNYTHGPWSYTINKPGITERH